MKRIGIVAATEGAGAGFVTAALAVHIARGEAHRERRLSGSITVAELGTGGMYDQLCADQWFRSRQIASYWNCLHNEGRLERMENPYSGINWLLRTPGDTSSDPLERGRAVKMIYSAPGALGLFDFSSSQSEDLFYLLEDMECVVAVIDPLPSRLLRGYERLYRLKMWKKPVCWVVNRCDERLPANELKRLLGSRANPVRLPEIPRRELYAAEYGGVMFAAQPEIRSKLNAGLTQLTEKLCL